MRGFPDFCIGLIARCSMPARSWVWLDPAMGIVGDAHITDLHIWRIGPGAHAAIVSVAGTADREAIRERLVPVHELAHVTIETR